MREANNNSQKQQEKIDELEAQLQEAQDIVSELRNELRYALSLCLAISYFVQRTVLILIIYTDTGSK